MSIDRHMCLCVCLCFALSGASGCTKSDSPGDVAATSSEGAAPSFGTAPAGGQAGGTEGQDPPPADDGSTPPTPGEVEPVQPQGVPGLPCATSTACPSGYCVAGRDGMECAVPCGEGICPEGWNCEVIPEGDGGAYALLCLDPLATQCQPCIADADCNPTTESTYHRCIEAPAGGRFCASNCGPKGAACEVGFTCVESPLPTGEMSRQCLPYGDTTCACNGLGKAIGMSTLCEIPGEHGVCYGTQTCGAEGLGPCAGTPSSPEECNAVDDDCDGQIDEGVESPCGGCDTDCTISVTPGSDHVVSPTDGEGTGALEVETQTVEFHFIWIANSGENTVSKLDTDTGKELARYNVCSNPSRTAVDQQGDCWYGCRTDGMVGKISTFLAGCIDANGNGEIETSKDLNDDGFITPNEMMPPGQDECMLFSTKPNPSENTIRALGVDAENHVWIGLWNQMQLMRLEPTAGAVVQTISIPANPYGLAIDKEGTIWVAGRGGSNLTRVNPATNTATAMTPGGCIEPYGIAVDANGDVWIANYGCGGNVAWRYQVSTGQWQSVPNGSKPRGIAASLDGHIYVANDSASRVAKINIATMQTVGYIELGGGRHPVGIAVDSKGFVWAVNQNTSSATKVNPETLAIELEHPVGSNPYTYSDMTGYALLNFTTISGQYLHTFEGWQSGATLWEHLTVSAQIPGDGSHVKVSYRIASSVAAIEDATWQGPFGPFPPAVMPLAVNQIGAAMQVRVTAHAEEAALIPLITGISVKAKQQQP
jgi:streptogramin lyase